MSPILLAAAGVGLSICFLYTVAACSLRDFSRSRLSDLCDERGKPNRFGEVLKRYSTAFLACETIALLALLLFLVAAVLLSGMVTGRLAPAMANRVTEAVPAPSAWKMTFDGGLITLLALFTRVIFPWTFARVSGETFLLRFWPLISATETLLSPLISVTRRFDRLIHRAAGRPDPAQTGAAAITDELRSVVDEGRREGVFEAEASSMIERVIQLQNEDIGSVMTPRTDMMTIRAEATIEQAREKFIEAGHSRVPVIGESIDDIVGILYAKDLLVHLNGPASREQNLLSLVRTPFYVPVTNGADTVLETMRRERVHMAIVVDEYGGVAGLVTMEDVLEEIVGDIVDEYDPAEETGINHMSPDLVEAEGWVHIDDLNEQFDLELPEDGDYDTIGGFVFNQLSRVPEIGEQFTFQNLRLTVTEADRRKVTKVRIDILKTQPTASEAQS